MSCAAFSFVWEGFKGGSPGELCGLQILTVKIFRVLLQATWEEELSKENYCNLRLKQVLTC
jgi:hypothetical protein